MKKHKRHDGFTLVEVLISIAVIGILASAALVSLSGLRNGEHLKTAQREAATAIKTAQNYALHGKTQSGDTPCGYGFRFRADGKTYDIFYNSRASAYDSCEDQNKSVYYRRFRSSSSTNPSIISETFVLSSGAELTSPVAETVVYFTVPYGMMFDNVGYGYPSSGHVLVFSLGGKQKTITVSYGGKIEEEN